MGDSSFHSTTSRRHVSEHGVHGGNLPRRRSSLSTGDVPMIENNSDDENDEIQLAFAEERYRQKHGYNEDLKLLSKMHTWRTEKMKTVSVALVLCLHPGVDPPDVVKTNPCARLEAWFDPLSVASQRALEIVGTNLQQQYEKWQPRARYRQIQDPCPQDLRKLCMSLRRNAKEERVLFHYNGHGVPKPTANGEIWVFNTNYTQYIPLTVRELLGWMSSPSLYVFDCSNAGTIVNTFKTIVEQQATLKKTSVSSAPVVPTTLSSTSKTDDEKSKPTTVVQNLSNTGESSKEPSPFSSSMSSNSTPDYGSCILWAACAPNQILPMNPELPADLFTSCLTTPIRILLRWWVLQNSSKLIPGITKEVVDYVPGSLSDRRSMLGELNWIFTAVTDTIAWSTLSRDMFQRLFRQDLLVASLFRNFLAANRIMRTYDCTPVSYPSLPPTHKHPMWDAWDLAVDTCMSQLSSMICPRSRN